MFNTGKLHVYNSFPLVYHLLNSGEWMDMYEQWMKSYEQEKSRENQSEVQVHTHTEKFKFFTRCIFEKSVLR